MVDEEDPTRTCVGYTFKMTFQQIISKKFTRQQRLLAVVWIRNGPVIKWPPGYGSGSIILFLWIWILYQIFKEISEKSLTFHTF
jgi:hypothetical protein